VPAHYVLALGSAHVRQTGRMANGFAVQLLAQDVHWLDEEGVAHPVDLMNVQACRRALALIHGIGEAVFSKVLAHLRVAESMFADDNPATAILTDLGRAVGVGWLQQAPLVRALEARGAAFPPR
jgi:hypothetical protein